MKLIIPKNGQPTAQADPYILKTRGKYYIYSTASDGVNVYTAEKLFGPWAYVGKALEVKGQHEYWAPCVIEHQSQYFMYYSSFTTESDDVHLGCIKVAVSDRPDGGFAYLKDLAPAFSIDAQVVENKEGLFMFYSVNDYEAERAGTYIVVDKMISPVELVGKPMPVVKPSLDQEIFCRDRFRKGQHWHTIEGASYLYANDRHYLLYSGNCYENPDYFVGCAVAEGGDDLTKLSFRKFPDENTYAPVIRRNEVEEGTGHNSVIYDDGKWYMIYHARDIDDRKSYDTRTARIAEIVFEGKDLKIRRI